MRTVGMGTLLARLVALALPLAGCCETTHHTAYVDADGGTVAGPASGDAGVGDAATTGPLNCQALCLQPIIGRCLGWEIESCERADPSGATIACRYVDTQCPDMLPLPRTTCGRRTDGVAPASAVGDDATGRALAQMAALEAASIPAFARLGRELAAHGAPASLRRSVERARRDEVRHAATMRGLARAHGAAVGRVTGRAAGGVRPLATLAIENAVEGCVRETWGAAVARFQAERAVDPALRRAMATIARDEARHAALAWRVHVWAQTKLDATARAACARALREEVSALRRELDGCFDDATARALGVPTGAAARALAGAIDGALWGRA